MYHKIKAVVPRKGYKLIVSFVEGVTMEFDVNQLFKRFPIFNELKNNNLFYKVHIEKDGYALIWNNQIDLDCDSIYETGKLIKSPFNGLISFVDATKLWNLNESTLRKAVSYGKLINGVDVIKFGRQWIITIEALIREYGPRKI